MTTGLLLVCIGLAVWSLFWYRVSREARLAVRQSVRQIRKLREREDELYFALTDSEREIANLYDLLPFPPDYDG